MNKLFAVFFTTVILMSMATSVMAKPNPELTDGRNGNSEKNGSFDIVVSEGPYYVGEEIIVGIENLVIDGPIDTLVINGIEEIKLPTTIGKHTVEVTATTYFKNGKKIGQIHTQISESITITVIEKPDSVLPVATTLSSSWNGGNENNTVRVYYTITIDGQTINHHTNFNHKDREAGLKEVEKDGNQFIVLYLAP
ncbi:hypothetical protein J2S74_004448 [Evansella vedderi]|uniref:Uncharacterized protein n=1 Tax=Evansella vedderi TaxID=38282 RepID=A0ABU0A2U9_9BACI|nr:hypothetical protein [Evansella vedderi]MDQ0257003.1 hypothetical protein [Evansella vedderi]